MLKHALLFGGEGCFRFHQKQPLLAHANIYAKQAALLPAKASTSSARDAPGVVVGQ